MISLTGIILLAVILVSAAFIVTCAAYVGRLVWYIVRRQRRPDY